MPTWHVEFTKEFSINVASPTREAVIAAAEEVIKSGDLNHDWDTGNWRMSVWARPELCHPDHGLKNGVIVNIQDADEV